MIDGGISIPNLEPWFSAPYALKEIKLSDASSKVSWTAYFQAEAFATHLTPMSVEFALFRLSRESLRFVNVEKNDAGLSYILLQYVSRTLSR